MWHGGNVGTIGLGCMRLSTDRDRDEAHALATLHAAFDAGVTLLDTADAYCWDDSETGHNERLIARALQTWPGDRSRILIATKGGLIRPQGNWIPDGRAKHLAAACEASRRALGVERIALYQLHVPDPRTPLATSVRALDALKRDGLIAAIGLCNVTVGQIEEAAQITPIDAVQVELSIWQDAAIFSGVVEYCAAHDITLLAHRPLGGAQRRRKTANDPALSEAARRHHATAHEIALAWLRDLSPVVLPLPGATRVESVVSTARAAGITLTSDDRATLDERFPSRRALHLPGVPVQHEAPRRDDGEVLLIMGLPAAGKSTLAQTFVAQGYERLNRDDEGGSLNGLLPALDQLIASGSSRIVLDNTYVSRKSRRTLVERVRTHGLPVRCVSLATSVDDAQVNAVSRMIARYGRILTPDEMTAARKKDVNAIGPAVQFRYQRQLEPPDVSEGFSRIDVLPFARRRDPSYENRAVILWCDGVIVRSRSGKRMPATVDDLDVDVPGERARVLRRYREEGWRLLGMSWQPELDEGSTTAADAAAIFTRVQELLGLAIEIEYCPHGGGPPVCWCRKPLPGLGVLFIERHRLDPARCLYVGASAQDPGFARKLGFQYREAGAFFAGYD